MFPVTFPPTFPLNFSFRVAFFLPLLPAVLFYLNFLRQNSLLTAAEGRALYASRVFVRFFLMPLTIPRRYLAFRVNVNDDERLLQFFFFHPAEVIPVDLLLWECYYAHRRCGSNSRAIICTTCPFADFHSARDFSSPCNSILANAAFRDVITAERKEIREEVLFKCLV